MSSLFDLKGKFAIVTGASSGLGRQFALALAKEGVNVAIVAMPGFPISAYATTKGAVLMMTKSLANEWAKHGVTVNAIGPAYFPSEMTSDVLDNKEMYDAICNLCPMGRPGRDGELDGALIYFASDASSYTTGQLLQIDGGWTTI
ncbi:hypothetical protein LXJ15735_38640 [Lacrimispora xylanolytica]